MIFLIYLISVLIGVSAITLSVIIYGKYKKDIIRIFLFIISSLFAIQLSLLLSLYYKLINTNDLLVLTLIKILDVGGSGIFIFGSLLLFFKIVDKTTRKTIYFAIIPAVLFVAIYTLYVISGFEIYKILAKVIFNGIIIFITLGSFVYFKNIGDYKLKVKLKMYAIISILFLPIFLIESFRDHFIVLKNVSIIEAFSLPLYFSLINILNILFGKDYLNTPPYIKTENNQINEYFIKKFLISDRENEIIQFIREGLTYKEIAERLFLAYKTVDNHIQTIYKKTGVTSKQQLKSLININS